MGVVFFFISFLSSTALLEWTVLLLFLFLFPSTGLEVTYSISLVFMVWIVPRADFGKYSGALSTLPSVGLMAFSSVLTPQWLGL